MNNSEITQTGDAINEYLEQLRASRNRYRDFIKMRTETLRGQYVDRAENAEMIEGFSKYDSSLGGQYGYFGPFGYHSFLGLAGFTTVKDIRKWVKKRRKESGKKVLAVDFFGQGRACIELGADKVIATTFLQYKKLTKQSKIEQFNGDALSPEISGRVIRRIQELKSEDPPHGLHLIFFRPIDGLSHARANMYVFKTLYDDLRAAYEELEDGGLIFLSSFAYGHDISRLQRIFLACDCEGLIAEPSRMREVCIRKDIKIAVTLPSEKDIAQRIPTFYKGLVEFDRWDAKKPTEN